MWMICLEFWREKLLDGVLDLRLSYSDINGDKRHFYEIRKSKEIIRQHKVDFRSFGLNSSVKTP
jgi:hypothetical protein